MASRAPLHRAAATARRSTHRRAGIEEQATLFKSILSGAPLKALFQGAKQAIVRTFRLTEHRVCKEARAVDGDGLDHTRAPRFRTELVVGAQNDTRPTPHLDLDGLTVVHEREEPFNSIPKGNEAREPKLFHGFKAPRRTTLRIAAPPGLAELDEQGLEPDKVARLRKVREYRCRRCTDPDTLLKAELHESGRVS